MYAEIWKHNSVTIPLSEWGTIIDSTVPQQATRTDCAVFSAMFALFKTFDISFADFNNDANYWRRKIAYDLLFAAFHGSQVFPFIFTFVIHLTPPFKIIPQLHSNVTVRDSSTASSVSLLSPHNSMGYTFLSVFLINAIKYFKKIYRSVDAKILLKLKQRHRHHLIY